MTAAHTAGSAAVCKADRGEADLNTTSFPGCLFATSLGHWKKRDPGNEVDLNRLQGCSFHLELLISSESVTAEMLRAVKNKLDHIFNG